VRADARAPALASHAAIGASATFLKTSKPQRSFEGVSMAVKSKSNRKNSKGRMQRAKPLLGRSDDVRRSNKVTAKEPVPGYVTMPMLLMSRFPLEVWRAQTRLAYQGVMMMQTIVFGRPIGVTLPMP